MRHHFSGGFYILSFNSKATFSGAVRRQQVRNKMHLENLLEENKHNSVTGFTKMARKTHLYSIFYWTASRLIDLLNHAIGYLRKPEVRVPFYLKKKCYGSKDQHLPCWWFPFFLIIPTSIDGGFRRDNFTINSL